MLNHPNKNEIHVWRVRLNRLKWRLRRESGARAARFETASLKTALSAGNAACARSGVTDARLDFALRKRQPYLPHVPEIQFNLTFEKGDGGVALDIPVTDIGVLPIANMRPSRAATPPGERPGQCSGFATAGLVSKLF